MRCSRARPTAGATLDRRPLQTPGYTFAAEDEALEFVSPSPVGDDWCVVDLKGHIVYRVTAAEAATMERAGLVGPETREQRIRDELARETH